MSHDWTQATDEELARALKQGEERAFDVLVHRHQGRLFAVAYRMTMSRDDALDVVQETLVKAYTKIDRWRPTGSVSAWLVRLVTNQAIDHLRRQKRHRHASLDHEQEHRGREVGRDSPVGNPARRARGTEITDRIHEAMEVLSPSQRTVFVLRHYEGMTLAEIAPVLGCSLGSVKVHLFRALKKLQNELGDLREE